MFEMMHLTIICCYFYEFFCLVPSNWHLLLKKATFQFTEYIYGNRLKTHFTCIMQNLLGNDSYKKYAG